MDKRKVLVISLLAALIAICAMGTTAYFTDTSTATNVITSGSIKIELVETAIPVDGGDPVPFEDVTGVMPGAEISKIVEVKNVGESAAYVRISVDKAIAIAADEMLEGDLSLVELNINTEDWTEFEGFYYYNEALAPGETTTPLFTTVSFDIAMGNEYQNSTATVKVTAEAIQVANNGANALEAAGWPAAEEEA